MFKIGDRLDRLVTNQTSQPLAWLNSTVALAILALNMTYAIPQGFALFAGRKSFPTRDFNLGPIFGPFCNAFTCAWVSVFTVLFCFPLFNPPEASNMNYVSVVIAGVILIIAALWFCGKWNTFVGPVTFQ
jgi:choline transport protein